MAKGYTASITAWVAKTERRIEAVFKQSAQDVFDEAQRPVSKGGNMRVDTGFLRNSLIMQLNGSTSLTGGDAYTLTIAQAKLGDTIFGGWSADYAIPREYGANGQAPDRFAGQAAAQWQSFVSANAAKAKAIN